MYLLRLVILYQLNVLSPKQTINYSPWNHCDCITERHNIWHTEIVPKTSFHIRDVFDFLTSMLQSTVIFWGFLTHKIPCLWVKHNKMAAREENMREKRLSFSVTELAKKRRCITESRLKRNDCWQFVKSNCRWTLILITHNGGMEIR